MKTPLTTLKRLTFSAALAATMTFGLLGGQSIGPVFADGLPLPTDLPVQVIGPTLGAGSEQSPSDTTQATDTSATDSTQATQQTGPDGDVQAAGAIVQTLFGR